MKYKLIKEYPGSPKLGTKQSVTQTYDFLHLYPEFWQPVVEKNYEILSFLFYGNTLFENINGKFNGYNEKSILYDKKHLIHSVKRLSDGEIFTIGDKVIDDHFIDKICIINSIFITNDGVRVNYKNLDKCGGYNNPLDKLVKAKQLLFTTEDGVDIFEGDEYYSVNEHYWTVLEPKNAYRIDYETYHKNKHNFSTKPKAEEYILLNKPCLSINDLSNIKEKYGTLGDSLIKHSKDLVKSKIQQSI